MARNNDLMTLAIIGGVGFFLWKNSQNVERVGSGIADVSEGIGTGFQGIGGGVGQAFEGVGGGLGIIGSEIGQTFESGSNVFQAGLDRLTDFIQDFGRKEAQQNPNRLKAEVEYLGIPKISKEARTQDVLNLIDMAAAGQINQTPTTTKTPALNKIKPIISRPAQTRLIQFRPPSQNNRLISRKNIAAAGQIAGRILNTVYSRIRSIPKERLGEAVPQLINLSRASAPAPKRASGGGGSKSKIIRRPSLNLGSIKIKPKTVKKTLRAIRNPIRAL